MSVRFMRVRVHIYGKIICAECTYICDGDVSLWRASKPPYPTPNPKVPATNLAPAPDCLGRWFPDDPTLLVANACPR